MKVLVVYAHPDSASFNHAVLDEVLAGLQSARHEVRVRDLYAEGFEPRLSREEKRAHLSPPESKPQLAEHFADLRWCDALVLVHPTWWGAQPAMLKGWIDRVFISGTTYSRRAIFDHGRFKGKRAMVAVTTGAPEHAFGPDSLNGRMDEICCPCIAACWHSPA